VYAAFSPARDQELQGNMELRLPSPPAHVLELHDTKGKRSGSPPTKDKDLQDTTGKMPPPPPVKDLHLYPSTKQPEVPLSTDRAPPTHQPVYENVKDSSSSAFFVSEQKVQNINKNACRQMFNFLKPFKKDVVVDEPSKDNATAVLKFFSCHKKYQYQEPLDDLGIPGMTVEEYWEDGDKDHNEFEYGKPLITKQVHAKFMWPMIRLHEWYYIACVCGLQFIKGRTPEAVFKSRSFDLNIEMFELHTIYRLRMLNITMMTVICTLVHVCDKEKRLGFMSNKKSETFKGISNKKRATTIRKAQQKLTKEKRDLASTHIGQLF
jgi:hypothetical protein